MRFGKNIVRIPCSADLLYLSAVNDTEAIVKGFGRNMKETVFLGKKDGRFTLTVMGLTLERTVQ